MKIISRAFLFLVCGHVLFGFAGCSHEARLDRIESRNEGITRRTESRQDRIDARTDARQERWKIRGEREDERARAAFDSW